MKNLSFKRLSCHLLAAISLAAVSLPAAANGTDYTHTGLTSGNWSVTTDWSPNAPAGGPNAIGDIVRYQGASTISTTQNTVGGVTVGKIILQGANNNTWAIIPTNAITMNNSGLGATISNTDSSTGAANALTLGLGTLTLADNLLISNTGGSTNTSGAIQISSAIGGTGNLTLSSVANTVTSASSFAGAIRIQNNSNTFSGTILVQKGATTFNNAGSFGGTSNVATNIITLGQSSQGSATLESTAGVVLPNNIVVASGTGGTLVLGSASTGNAGYSGTITLNGDLSLTSASTSGTNTLTISNVISGAGALTKVGTGDATFSGTSSNTYAGKTTVSSAGTLILNKTAGLNAISSTGSTGVDAAHTDLQITNGSVKLAAANQIIDTAKIGLSGGTLNTGGFNEVNGAAGNRTPGMGALTLSATSTIDFGSGASVIEFNGLGTHTGNTILAITNWSGTANTSLGTDQLLFAGTTTDFSALYNPADVTFNGVSGYNLFQITPDYYEVTAAPEPSTWAAGVLAICAVGYTQRRRFSRLAKRA